MTTTLHIEHGVTGYEAWKAVFDRFQGVRDEGGVRGYRVHRPIDDPNYVVIDLDFDDDAGATAFLAFLREKVWPQAPALVGTPHTKVLQLSSASDVSGS